MPSTSDAFSIYCCCQFEKCQVKIYLECDNRKLQTLSFKIFIDGVYEEKLHQGKKGRNVSGQKRQIIASEVITFGTKNVQF